MIESSLERVACALELIAERMKPLPVVNELATLQQEATYGHQSMPVSTSRAIDNTVIQEDTTPVFDTFKDAPAVLNVEGELGDPANEKQYRENLTEVLTSRGVAIPPRTRTTTLFKMYKEGAPAETAPPAFPAQAEVAPDPAPDFPAFPAQAEVAPVHSAASPFPAAQAETTALPTANLKDVLGKLQNMMTNGLATHSELLKMLQEVGGVTMLKNLREDQAPIIFAAADLFDSAGKWNGVTPEFRTKWSA